MCEYKYYLTILYYHDSGQSMGVNFTFSPGIVASQLSIRKQIVKWATYQAEYMGKVQSFVAEQVLLSPDDQWALISALPTTGWP